MRRENHVQQNVDAYKERGILASYISKLSPFRTLGSKLFLFFVVSMVIAVMTVGFISYYVSSNAMEEKVSEVAEQSLQQTSEKLDYLLNFYENISLQLTMDQDFMGDLSYRLNLIHAGKTEGRMNTEGKILDKLKQTATTNKVYIQLFDEHPYTQVDTGRDYVSALFSSGNGTSSVSFYQPYYQEVIAGNGKVVWLGAIPKGEAGAETVYVSMGKLLKTNSGNYLLFIEFKSDVIAEALANLKSDAGQLPELVTAEGELVYSDAPYEESGEAVLLEEQAWDENSGEEGQQVATASNAAALEGGEALGDQTQQEDSALALQRRIYGTYEVPAETDQLSGSYIQQEQLIVYSTSMRTGWSLVQNIPLKELTAGIDRILSITWVLIGGAILISLLLGGLIARMISRPISEVSALMRQVEQGNLALRMESNRRDEIGALSQSFNQMAANIGALITRTSEVLQVVLKSAQRLQQVSRQMDTSAKEISIATDEIARGADVLSTQAEEGSVHAASIQDEMSALLQNNETMQQHALEVSEESKRGIQQMQTLLHKTKQGEALTRQSMLRAETLVASTKEIGKILDMLDDIAKRTNLLSLNAAIEASRAGEHGRGFMVVAKEIRQLADQSRESIVVVNSIIGSIVEGIQQTVQAMNDSYPIYQEQMTVSNSVHSVFHDVDQRMHQFVDNIVAAAASANHLHVAQSTLSGMMLHVSATAEQSTAISEEVASTSSNQLAISSELVQVSQQLHQLSLDLQHTLDQFHVQPARK